MHRLTEQDFLETLTPEEYEFQESAKAAFDPEFDAPRDHPGPFVMSLVLGASAAATVGLIALVVGLS